MSSLFTRSTGEAANSSSLTIFKPYILPEELYGLSTHGMFYLAKLIRASLRSYGSPLAVPSHNYISPTSARFAGRMCFSHAIRSVPQPIFFLLVPPSGPGQSRETSGSPHPENLARAHQRNP